MLRDHIKNIIIENLKFEPTNDQNNLIDGLSEFILDDDSTKIFLIKGLCRYRKNYNYKGFG